MLGSAPPPPAATQAPSASSSVDNENSAVYSVALPEGWGDLRVRYKQRPPQPEDENHDLQLLFRVNESTRNEEDQTPHMQRMSPREIAKTSTLHCPPPSPPPPPQAKTAAKWSPPIVKYVTAKWNEWQYLKEGPKTVELEVAEVSSRRCSPPLFFTVCSHSVSCVHYFLLLPIFRSFFAGSPSPESVTIEEVQQLRREFDAMLARIAPPRPALSQTAPAQAPTQATLTPARPPPPAQPRSGKDQKTSSKSNNRAGAKSNATNKKTEKTEKKQPAKREGAS